MSVWGTGNNVLVIKNIRTLYEIEFCLWGCQTNLRNPGTIQNIVLFFPEKSTTH